MGSRGCTEPVTSNIGANQGDNLSPTLFNVFINDVCNEFDTNCDAVDLGDKKLSCLLYADDIVLLSDSASGL